jgi:excisionase family DNA binding protein
MQKQDEIPLNMCLFPTTQISQYLGVSTATVRRYVGVRQMPTLRLPNGAMRFRLNEVDSWLSQFRDCRGNITRVQRKASKSRAKARPSKNTTEVISNKSSRKNKS